MTLDRALKSAARNAHGPCREALDQILGTHALGLSLARSFSLLAQSLNSKEVALLAYALTLSEKTGTPISGLMEKLYRQIQVKRDLSRKITALSSQARAQGKVAIFLPCIMLLGLCVLVPGFLTPLFQSLAGQVTLLVALTLMVLASWLIRRITQPGDL